jgi:hypothetical protein
MMATQQTRGTQGGAVNNRQAQVRTSLFNATASS